jgi:hypothetical protein
VTGLDAITSVSAYAKASRTGNDPFSKVSRRSIMSAVRTIGKISALTARSKIKDGHAADLWATLQSLNEAGGGAISGLGTIHMVGFSADGFAAAFQFDTSILGNSNRGHEFRSAPLRMV